MTSDDLLGEAVEELYSADPEEFTRRRGELTARARSAGQAAVARQIAALRKPTRSAWVINQLTRSDPGAASRLGALGEELRAAERSGDGTRMRELSQARRQLIATLVRQTLAASGQQAAPAALREEITATLAAALADPEVADQIGHGTLLRPARRAGFGTAQAPVLALVPPSPDTRRDGKRAPAGPAAGRRGAGPAAGAARSQTARTQTAAGAETAGTETAAGAGTAAGTGTETAADRGLADAERNHQADAEAEQGPADAERDRQADAEAEQGPADAERDRRARAEAEALAEAERHRRQARADAEQALADADRAVQAARTAEQELQDSARRLEQQLADLRRRLQEARAQARQAEIAQRKARQFLARLPE